MLNSLIIGILFYLVIKLIIIPYIRLNFYKKQGLLIEFIPIVGNLLKMVKNASEKGDFFYDDKQKVKENPKLRAIVTCLGTVPVIQIIDPKLLKEFFSKQDSYIKNRALLGYFPIIAGQGLVFTENQKWKHQKRLISSIFHYEYLKEMITPIQDITVKHLDKLAKKSNLDYIKLLDVFQDISGDIVCSLFFNNNIEELEIDGENLTSFIGSILKESFTFLTDPLNFIFGLNYLKLGLRAPYRMLNKKIEKLRKFGFEIVKSKKENLKAQRHSNSRKDLLTLLLEKQQEGGENYISDEEIVHQFFVFFIAGMDTTSHLVAMLIYNLSQNLVYREELEIEMGRYYDEKNVKMDSLLKMECMGKFIKETLRMHSPAKNLFYREAINDHYIDDIKIKKGTFIQPAFAINDFNPLYYDEPEKFNPERWNKSEKNNKADGAFINIPFSAGMRSCIGQHMALTEAKIIFSEFLRRFEFKLSDNYKLRMTYRFVFEAFDDLVFDLKPKKLINNI